MSNVPPSSLNSLKLYQRWLYAFKIKSWPKLLVPFILGHSIGISTSARLDWEAFFLSCFSIVCGLIFIVLLNDWGDRRVDAIKRQMFPEGCSPKTIPDGLLSSNHLLVGSVLALAVALTSFVFAGLRIAAPWEMVQFGALMSMTFIAYTLPPIKLNYRGGGELLEMLGVGLLLPWSMAFLQTGIRMPPMLLQLLPFTLSMALASAIASGLSDEDSDRVGGKNTVVTTLGNATGRKLIEGLTLVAIVALIYIFWRGESGLPIWSIILAIAAVTYNFWKMKRSSKQAVTGAFREQAAYKKALHRAFWWASLLLSLGMLARFTLV